MQVAYLRSIAEGVRAAGGDVARWLARSGLSEAGLAAAAVEVDFERFEELIRNAYAMTRQPALGLLVGQQMVVASHGMVGFAAMSSQTVREGLELIARFTRIRTSMISMAIERSPGGLRLRFEQNRALGVLYRPILEAILLSISNELGPFSGGACRVRSAAFSFEAPGYEALARRLFGCEVRYGASWTGLEVPPEGLDAPLRTADPSALKEAARLCEQELERLTSGESTGSRVRRVLSGEGTRFPSLQSTARALHLTPRTLHRRLLAEGTSYRALREEVRRALALEHVRSGHLSVKEIAHRLGYSDVANFRRAFKRWEDAPPSAFRSSWPPGEPELDGPPPSRGEHGDPRPSGSLRSTQTESKAP